MAKEYSVSGGGITVANGRVYVGSDDANLTAYDATGSTNCTAGTCTPLFTATTGGAVTVAGSRRARPPGGCGLDHRRVRSPHAVTAEDWNGYFTRRRVTPANSSASSANRSREPAVAALSRPEACGSNCSA